MVLKVQVISPLLPVPTKGIVSTVPLKKLSGATEDTEGILMDNKEKSSPSQNFSSTAPNSEKETSIENLEINHFLPER